MPRDPLEARGPSEREFDVLSAVWSRGSATVAEAREALSEQHDYDFGYTTVLGLLQRLRTKGWVEAKLEGKAHRYFPTRSRITARLDSLARLRNLLFGGSREMMLAQIVEDPYLSRVTIERMRQILDNRLRQGSG